jgi:CRISPR-associated protein Csb1
MAEPMVPTAATIDGWADDLRGPVALTLRERLRPVEGDGAVIFPPTYAGKKNEEETSGYVIDDLPDGTKVAKIDSVGSQANRIEPLFKNPPFAELVPQIGIRLGNGKIISLFDVGHRLADAIVRASDPKGEVEAAFRALQHGDATKIAEMAPTSLVFGAWDSRNTQARLPRIVQSVIRASDVSVVHRSAQYKPPTDYAELGVINPKQKENAEKNQKSSLAKRGYVAVPPIHVLGGVLVRGEIVRTATVNLVVLRQLDGLNGTLLRRYILGLSLVAAVEPQDGYLRQGCLLTPDPDHRAPWELVSRAGNRTALNITPELALDYARSAAKAFGVDQKPRTMEFSLDIAAADVNRADNGSEVGEVDAEPKPTTKASNRPRKRP